MSGSTQGTATTTVSAVAPPGVGTADASEVEASKAQSLQCPTRAEGNQPLFQHRVTVNQCQSKQRGLYHKCFTCMHANGRG